MSNEINALQKFFDYLTQHNKTAQDVADEADALGKEDGAVTKAEFKKFIEGTGLNLTADEVSQIYKTFDTKTSGKIAGTKLNNRNALDSSEIAKMQEKLEAYAEIKEAIDDAFGSGYEGVTIPAELKAYVPKASVEESILASLDNNFQCRGNLEDLLNTAIAKAGANGYGQERFNSVLASKKAAGLVPSAYMGDDNIQGILSAYIRSLGAETDLSSIMGDVDDIVDGYFASAGIGTLPSSLDEEGDLEAFAWNDAQGLNGLQISVISNRISSAISMTPETYNKFKAEVDSAVQGFINDTCQGTFSQITSTLDGMNIGQEFNNSKYGKALSVLITYSDFSEPGNGTSALNNAFYNALKTALGEDFAKGLASADVNYVAEQGIYNTVLRTVYEMVLNGDIANDDQTIMNKMVELIINNYAEFKAGLGLDSANGKIDDLYNNVQTLSGQGGALAAVRNAAIVYLDAVTALGSEKLNSFIKAEFGGMDYKSAIEGLMSQSVIESKITKVQNKYNSMVQSGEIVLKVEPSSCTVDGWTVPSSLPKLRAEGAAQTISCQATIKDGNGNVLTNTLTNPITYAIAAIGGNTGSTAEVNPDTGEITLTPGTQDGTAIVKVKVMVDGVEVGTKELSFTVEKKPEFNRSNAGISTGGIHVSVGGSDLGWARSRNNAISNFKGTITDPLKQAAIAQGYTQQEAENAAKTLQSYFAAAMHAMDGALDKNLSDTAWKRTFGGSDKTRGAEGGQFTYTRYTSSGEVAASSSDTSTVRVDWKESRVNDYSDLNGTYASTGIYIGCDTTATDDYWCYVDGSRMIDLFISFLE